MIRRVAETPERIYERGLAAADEEGRLPMPPVHEWETFPFDGDLRVRPLRGPVAEEPPRGGERAEECWRCRQGEEGTIWTSEHWLLAPLAKPSGLPVVVILSSRAHLDLDDVSEDLAADLGRTLVRVHRVVAAVPHVARVHVCRWGDGSYHLHFWFMARPERLPQVRGTLAALWDDILPPTPEQVWRANLELVANALAGGR